MSWMKGGGGGGGGDGLQSGLTALKASRKTLLMAPIRSWISLSGEEEQELETREGMNRIRPFPSRHPLHLHTCRSSGVFQRARGCNPLATGGAVSLTDWHPILE